MDSGNRLWKWALIVGATGLAGLMIYPPGDRLKPGIDLAGGTSLIYEIDTVGLDQRAREGLAERVMNILKARVDPNSQFNLVWRPIGNTRLEIQMPRPPAEARSRRDTYEAARDNVREKNLTRLDLETALNLPADQRTEALDALVRGVEARRLLLGTVVTQWDAYAAASATADIEASEAARAAYEEALDAILQTNLPIGRLTDVLALSGSERESEIERLRVEFPAYAEFLAEVSNAYDAWISKRGTLEDPADLKRLLKGAGVLEFRILAERDVTNPTRLRSPGDASLRQSLTRYVEQLQKRGPRRQAGDRYAWFEIEDFVGFMNAKSLQQAEQAAAAGTAVAEKYAGKWYVLAHVDDGDQKFGLTQRSPKWALKRAMPNRDQRGRLAVDFALDPRGGAQFGQVTKLNIDRQLAIFLDGLATSHATIQSQIFERGQITGNFSQDEVLDIVRRLEAGSLPARLKPTPLQEKVTGPSLGEQNREMGLTAALYGLVVVAIFMLVYYLFLGMLADLALVLNLLFVLAVMAVTEATFTLQGIAGLILTVGMAVDANVLIFERIREERARDVPLKKAVRLGYEKAFSTIVDANLTTLITCVILGYVGSEEVKGFAMTLGVGVVTSMFTALFVTRVILQGLISIGLVKRLPMLHIIRRPNIDWLSLRKVFWPVSLVAAVGGVGFFVYGATTNPEAVFDIEFLGGTSVQVELADGVDMDAEVVRGRVTGKALAEGTSAAAWLTTAAEALESANVEQLGVGVFRVTAPPLSPSEVDALLRTTFEDSLALDGYAPDGEAARFETKPFIVTDATEENPNNTREVPVTVEDVQRGLASAAAYTARARTRLEGARVQTIADVGQSTEDATTFEVITVEPNKNLVRAAILGAMSEHLRVEQPIGFELVTDAARAPDGKFPVLEDYSFLGNVIGGDAPNDVRAYKGGVVLVFDQLNPPQTIDAIKKRFREMRLQPQFEQYESRNYDVFGLTTAPGGGDELTYSRVAMVVSDDTLLYSDDQALWNAELATPELEQAQEALSAEKSLRKVVSFAAQIASQTQQRALVALVLALAAIVAYVWLRFGTMQYGLAAIVATTHDVAITLGVITIADYLGIGDFRIDLAAVAALLTVVGYSLNDTIVVFDRIRENRGKLSSINPKIINNSINMTLSRTLLTSATTLLAVSMLYIFGGPGVHVFSFALLCGVVVGTYSSVGIAAPLLQRRRTLHIVFYFLVAVTVVSLAATATQNVAFIAVVAVLSILGVLGGWNIERRLDEPVAVAG